MAIVKRIASEEYADEKALYEANKAVKNIPQSDWEQSDETSRDFIKNKPFYDINVLSIIYEGQVDLTMHFYGFLGGTLEKKISCEKGKTYNVIFNGENNESIYQGEVVCEQDGSLTFDIPDSPFYVEISDYSISVYSNDEYVDESVFGEGIYNLKIEGNVTTLKTLDEKFIPDTIARIEDIPTKVSELTNDSGYYSASNPPPYPVTSVNGKTGAVSLDAAAVGARPSTWMPSASDVGALPSSTVIPTVPTKVSAFTNDAGYLTEHQDISGKADVTDVATYITPEQYGAKGDGTTDDSAAIQAAIDAAGSVSVVYLGAKKYKISTGLVLTGTYKTLICDGWIVYSGEDAAITVKNAYRCKMNINTVDAANGTALKLDATEEAVYSNDFTVDVIRNSNIGIHLYTNKTHISHNTLRNTYLAAKVTGVKVWADNGSNAYINENLWYLDWITGGCRYGIHLHSDEALNNLYGYGVNDNKFYSASLEGMADTDSAGIYLDKTFNNFFEKLRAGEAYGEYCVKFNGQCNRNDISLSQIYLDEVDTSGLASGSVHNILRCPGINSDHQNYYIVGDEVRVTAAHGITYIPDRYNYNVNVNADTFANNIITHIGTAIPTAVTFQSATVDGATFVVGGIYSDPGSMTRGFPLSVRFGDGVGHVLLNDNKGGQIIDNRTGKYDGKTLSVRWAGFHNSLNRNIWAVQEIGGNVGSVDVTKLAQNVGFASDEYGVILESKGGNKYRIVTTDGGLLTTVEAADVNQVPLSIDENNSIFNGTGYQNEKRISSGGEVKDAPNGTVTGFIPVRAGETVRFSGGNWSYALATNCVNYFNSAKSTMGYFTAQESGYDGGLCTPENSVVEYTEDGMYKIVVPNVDTIAYFRLSLYDPNGAPSDKLVVYVDREKEHTPIVESVNGKTGVVVLSASDVGAQPVGNYALKSEIPSVPVQSVNGKTGAVKLSASDVGARASDWMPSASDVGALPATTTIPTKTSQLTNDSGFVKSSDIPAGAAATNTSPKMNGTAAVGSETAFARGDHVHPSDTSRVPTSRKINGKALSADLTLSASDVGALASANYTTKALTVTYEDGTSETVTLVVSK